MSEASVVTSGSTPVANSRDARGLMEASTIELPTCGEFDRLIRRAGWIGQGSGTEPVVSFSSLFLAFLASGDEVSLAAWCEQRDGTLAGNEPRERAARRELARRAAELADWDAVERAVHQVARFSFETGRVLGAYLPDVSADEDDAPPRVEHITAELPAQLEAPS